MDDCVFDLSKGYIILPNDMINFPYEVNTKEYSFYMYCLFKANFRNKETHDGKIQKGEFVASYSQLSDETGYSIREVRTITKHLNSTRYLTQSKYGKSMKYSIESYSMFTDSTQYLTSKRQRSDIEVTTKNKRNKRNEVVVGEKSPTTYSTDFLRFWKVYTKKGKYKKDTYTYWKEQNYDEEVIKDIVYGAECYCKEFESDKLGMVYPRTFLENEMWEGYPRVKQRTEEEYQEDIQRAIGVL